MKYNYEYPRPALTVDLCLFLVRNWDASLTKTCLIQRGGDPYKGCWALPGGFVNEGESCEDAVIRETREEISVDISGLSLYNLGTFSKPGRDPRGWVVSAGFALIVRDDYIAAKITEDLCAADDAAGLKLFNVGYPYGTGLPKMAFDHADIMEKGFQILASGR